MTDKQIVNFMRFRAAQNGKQFGLSNPKLILYKNSARSNMYLAMRFDGTKNPFMFRFVENDRRAMFRVQPDHVDFENWKDRLLSKHGSSFELDYDVDILPDYVKHYVSYSIIQALQTAGMGFDLFSIEFPNDIDVVYGDETYEKASIEADLMGLGIDEFAEDELTTDLSF